MCFPIVTAPASEDGDVAKDKVDDGNEDDDDTEGLVKALQKVLDNLEELNKELRDLVSPRGGASTQQPPKDPIIDGWDTGKAWEQEYDLYPEASRDDINIRLYNQVGDLLHAGVLEPTDLEKRSQRSS